MANNVRCSWLAVGVLAAAVVTSAYAADHAYATDPTCPGVHTWHQMSTEHGRWAGTLTVINQHGRFMDENCQEMVKFAISPQHPKMYGTVFAPGSDLNFTYTLALAKQPESGVAADTIYPAKDPICHYIVSAYAPAVLQLFTTEINGAQCEVVDDDGMGADFVAN